MPRAGHPSFSVPRTTRRPSSQGSAFAGALGRNSVVQWLPYSDPLPVLVQVRGLCLRCQTPIFEAPSNLLQDLTMLGKNYLHYPHDIGVRRLRIELTFCLCHGRDFPH